LSLRDLLARAARGAEPSRVSPRNLITGPPRIGDTAARAFWTVVLMVVGALFWIVSCVAGCGL